MNRKNIIIFVAAFIIITVGMFFIGRLTGQQMTETKHQTQIQEMKTLIDKIYPPPPAEMYSLTGKIKEIYGASIIMEIASPDDYLPHPDGSARKTETRTANVTAKTTYTFFDYTQFDKQGNPKTSSITLKDLKTGDNITVKSEQNIRNVQSFDVSEIQKVVF